MDVDKHITLNKRPEIFAKCRHFWREILNARADYDGARQQTIDHDIITN